MNYGDNMIMCQHLAQIDGAETDDDVKLLFNVEEAAELLLATGYRKAICSLGLEDQGCLKASLLDYHCLLKVK